MIRIDAQEQEDSQQPWLDMIFQFRDIKVAEKSVAIDCVAMANGTPAGFRMTLPRFWQSILNENGEVAEFKFASGQLESSGAATRALVDWVCTYPSTVPQDEDAPDLPKNDYLGGRMDVSLVHLGQNDVDLSRNETGLKLFHEFEPYFELFLSVDPQNGIVRLNEKDPAYRHAQQVVFARAWKVDRRGFLARLFGRK